MDLLSRSDPEVHAIIEAEQQRQNLTLELIASENHVSAPVLEAMGSVLTDKYAEGYPRKRWYCGCENMDDIEQLAIDRAKKLFGAEHANVQPHSGTNANLSVYISALEAGDKIMGMDLAHGGHLSHGLPINLSGKIYKTCSYGVSEDTELLDMDNVREIALREKPRLIIVGASAYPRIIDFRAFGDIAAEIDAMVLADIAHIAGLIAGGAHPSPVDSCDFVTTTTHKTLRGPRGGIILCKEKWAKKIDMAVFPGMQGGPIMQNIAAKAVSFGECLTHDFRRYAADIIENAKALAEAIKESGWRLVSGGTDNHLLLIDIRSRDEELTGHVAAKWMARAGLVANKNAIPFDTRSPFHASGIRLGTPALTSRKMGTEQMKTIGGWIDEALRSGGDEAKLDAIRTKVEDLCRQFPIPSELV
ncbi:MAG: serine hydroxymethyltransferase [Phycisphaerae bacterium]